MQTDWKHDLLPYLPQRVQEMLRFVREDEAIEEIRLRAEKPLQLCFADRDRLVYASRGRPAVTAEDCRETLERVCERSLYAWEDELKNGFITLAGGYRVGVCGRTVSRDGRAERMMDVTGLNFRISRAVVGVSQKLLPSISDGRFPYSTLVISAPGCGKTTMLRDLARQCSYGGYGVQPCRVGVVDSRYELAGSIRGVPQFDLGPRTDVLSGSGKAEGMRLMVASMSPHVLIVDELSFAEDIEAAREAAACGVRLLAGAHAGDVSMLIERPTFRELIRSRLFDRYVLLGRSHGVGTVEAVFDAACKPISETVQCLNRSS